MHHTKLIQLVQLIHAEIVDAHPIECLHLTDIIHGRIELKCGTQHIGIDSRDAAEMVELCQGADATQPTHSKLAAHASECTHVAELMQCGQCIEIEIIECSHVVRVTHRSHGECLHDRGLIGMMGMGSR